MRRLAWWMVFGAVVGLILSWAGWEFGRVIVAVGACSGALAAVLDARKNEED